MNRQKLPCIKNKCITYPACKNKMIVKCDTLHKHIGHASTIMRYSKYKYMWKYTLKYFPNITEIFPSTKYSNVIFMKSGISGGLR